MISFAMVFFNTRVWNAASLLVHGCVLVIPRTVEHNGFVYLQCQTDRDILFSPTYTAASPQFIFVVSTCLFMRRYRYKAA